MGADARSDLFAFGAMLYEMIAGRRAVDAESPADLIAAILEREPPALSTQVPALPPALDRLIATCLTKDADERWQTTRDLLRELRWVQDDSSARHAHPSMVTNPSRRTIAGVATLAIAAAVVGAFGLARVIRQPGPPPARVSFQIYPPAGTSFPRGAAEMAVSPDGSRLVFVALSADGRRKLWLRRFDAADSQPIDGSEDALDPFWSPDSRSIAFFAQNKLKRIAEGGGVAQDICQTHRGPRGGAWSRHGTILFGGWGEPLWRVSDTGGAPIQATALLESRLERQHGWPVFLPDGRRFLYLAASTDPAANAVFEGTLDGSDTRRVFAADSGVGIAGDYLITLSKGLLSARTYDAARVETGGAPMTIAEHIAYDAPLRSGPAFSVANGIVAFRNANPDSGLTWFDRKGHDLGSFPGRADFHHPWLSPDDKYIAVEKTDPATGQHTIWILDPLRGTSSRLLLSSSGAHLPVWSPDGRRIAFGSNRSRGVDLRDIAADGSGSDRVILDGNESSVHVTDWSLDGRFLLYHTMRGGQFDIFVVTLSPTVVAQPFLETPAEERQGQFSPDVHWIAYTSSESGSAEVYVRQFPDTGRKWQISTRGGAQPRWRRDGKELFYLARDGKLIAVSVAARPAGMEIGSPRALFDTGIRGSFLDRRNQFVVTRDGQRFLVNISAEDEDSAPITVMMNWDAAR